MGSLNFGVLPVGVNVRDIQGPERRFGRVYNTDDSAGAGQKSNELLTFDQVVESIDKVGQPDNKALIVRFKEVDLSTETGGDTSEVMTQLLEHGSKCQTFVYDLSNLKTLPSIRFICSPRSVKKEIVFCRVGGEVKKELELLGMEQIAIIHASVNEALDSLKVQR